MQESLIQEICKERGLVRVTPQVSPRKVLGTFSLHRGPTGIRTGLLLGGLSSLSALQGPLEVMGEQNRQKLCFLD